MIGRRALVRCDVPHTSGSKVRVSRQLRLLGALAAVIGATLFVWSVRRAGASAVTEGLKRVGAGFVVVFLLGGVRSLFRAVAWRLCLDPEHRLTVGSIFTAYLAGDAIGNVTPFGFLISEPAKIVLVRTRIDVPVSVAALAVENLFYSATVVAMLVTGTAALLLSFAVPRPIRIASLVTLAAALALAVVATWITLTRRRIVSGAAEWLIRRRIAVAYLRERLPHIRQTGDRIFGFVERRSEAVVAILALEVSYHVAAVAEIWFALGLITGTRPDLLTAFVLEYVNRTITIAFQFVPMWLGVDEAGTSLATSVLNLGSAAGVSLALVRKTRVLLWTAIGIAVLLHRGLSLSGTAREAEALDIEH